MLAKVLAHLPGVASLHEPQPWMNTEAYLAWAGKRDSEWLQERLAHKRDGLIRQRSSGGLLYVESSHFLSHLIPELSERYGARFIHLYRDGRDFTRSGLERGWYRSKGFREWMKTHIRRRVAVDVGFSWVDHRLDPPSRLESRLEKIAWLWAEINQVILRDLAGVPDSDQERVRLEDFGQETIERLAAFLGLQADQRLLRHMLTVADRRPNRTVAFEAPSPRAWSEVEKERFSSVAGPMQERLGYSAPCHAA